jgi:uncharacterized protein
VLSNPAYGNTLNRTASLAGLLRTFRESGEHFFWPDDVSLLDSRLLDLSLAGGHRHLTDIYLLALAKRHGGRLVTFDRTIPCTAVAGGADAIEVVSAADDLAQ